MQYNTLAQINRHAAGLDIGDDGIWAAVPHDRDTPSVRVFDTFTCDLQQLADWLQACGVETVAMESTGVYWIPALEILEARGFELYLVNAYTIKHVPGRKTDVLDCQWIQQLHTSGLLRATFRPEQDIAQLRCFVRQRQMLLRYRAAHIQHMQKALQQINLNLTNVLKDITGQTGMQIIRTIIASKRNPAVLAQMRNYRCKHSQEEIAKSLQGNYRPEHLFTLQQAVALYDFYTAQLVACDAEVEALYTRLENDLPLPPLSSPSRPP